MQGVLESLESRQLFSFGVMNSSFGNLVGEPGISLQETSEVDMPPATHLAADSSGRLYILGNPLSLSNFAIGRLTPAGALDTSFATDGILFNDFTGSGHSFGTGIGINGEDEITVGGTYVPTSTVRYGATTRFDVDGDRVTAYGPGLTPSGYMLLAVHNLGGSGGVVARQVTSDGDMALLGGINPWVVTMDEPLTYEYDNNVFSYVNAGATDSDEVEFGSGATPFSGNTAYDAVGAEDGTVAYAGLGAADPTAFFTDPKLYVNVNGTYFDKAPTSDFVTGIGQLRVIIIGTGMSQKVLVASREWDQYLNPYIQLTEWNVSNGHLNSSFGVGGVATISGDSLGGLVADETTGNIYVVCGSGGDMTIVGLESDGDINLDFANDGVLSTQISGLNFHPEDVIIQGNLLSIVGGFRYDTSGSDDGAFVAQVDLSEEEMQLRVADMRIHSAQVSQIDFASEASSTSLDSLLGKHRSGLFSRNAVLFN